jgi:hypothetical protein
MSTYSSPSPYRSSPESLAIIQRIVDESPPFTKRQLNRITAITGLLPRPEDYDAAPD